MAKRRQRTTPPARGGPKTVEIRASTLTADVTSAVRATSALAKLSRDSRMVVLVGASDAPDDKGALAIARALDEALPLATFSCETDEVARRMLHARRVADQLLADRMFTRTRRAQAGAR